MVGDNHSPRNKAAGIAGPALNNWQTRQIRRFDNFLADCLRTPGWTHVQKAKEDMSPLPGGRK
jgi:hypothetical protein